VRVPAHRRDTVRLLLALSIVVVATLAAGQACSAAPSGPSETTDTTTAAPGPLPRRDVYAQPFSWDSIWNLPLATSAQYEPFDAKIGRLYPDIENISVDPDAPVKQLDADPGGAVHVDPDLSANGKFNNCSTLLLDSSDDETVIQGQPMKLSPGDDPSWAFGSEPTSLTGQGIEGCHGGSGLSGIGGDIRKGELPGKAPIRHALKFSLPCTTSCSTANGGHRWPAVKADSGYEGRYRGDNSEVNMGALLALPPDTDLSKITEPDTRKVAQALKTYGGYVVDESGGAPSGSFDVQSTAVSEFPDIDSDQMRSIVNQLSVVTNSGPGTPGGGALHTPRLAACARPFSDGTGGAPAGC
jgi:hypothetical protein